MVLGRLRARMNDGAIRRRAPARYRRLLRQRVSDWLLESYHPAVIQGSTWFGVPAMKSPLDAWIYQEILYEVRPQVVVELGNAIGGGALYLASLLDLLGDNGQVVCVDYAHGEFRAAHDRIVTVSGDTRSPEVLARVRELCAGRRTLVIHDADHRAERVLEDLRNYAPLVSPGSYMIVEDGIADLLPNGLPSGPLAAVAQFLEEAPELEVDRSRERFGVTYNPLGYLRRRPDGDPARRSD